MRGLRTPGTVRRALSGAGGLALAAALLLPAVPLAAVATAAPAAALGNGLALTPPMGFNDWNAYGCNTSEALIKQTADKMVSSGMAAAGYTYVNIDDCWLQHSRDGAGDLQPDFTKFPDGISGTAAYVHSKGLKLGIYEDAGTATCAGYPGSLGHEQQDARSFASWGVDYLKYDNCNNTGAAALPRYTAMRDALAATGRPIVFSLCDWGEETVQNWGAGVGNLWRTTGDINASYGSMLSIFHSNLALAAAAGPGHWNDPDMLETGNGMSTVEDRSEFSLWAEMAAPLIDGSNLLGAGADTLSILTNKAVIAVDQDALGVQGSQVSAANGLDVLAKPLAGGDVSVLLFNETGSTATISTSAAAIGKSGASSYGLTDLWSGAKTTTAGTISAPVPAHGTVMYRVSGGTTTLPAAAPVQAVGAGKCLDAYNNSLTNGSAVEIWSCNGGVNQAWTRASGGRITVYGGTKCLDAYDNQTAPGTKVEIWDCNGGANQQWRANSDGSITGVQSGLCLDVTGASTADGALAELWTCNGGANQRWS
ncbi:glycoside hydrolase family 27 protein [Actinacidiphila cocklensis]|uniref:glycoside hydrolase family 27 protein n=1 Tax=Actinacidiphila cocklensis TaxID=887465 RepID=UPI003BEF399E